MHNRNLLFILVFSTLLVPSCIAAGPVILEYAYGTVELEQGGRWLPLEVGGAVPENSHLRLGSGSVAELSFSGTRVTLSEAGTYGVAELLRSSRSLSSWGIGQVVLTKIRNLFRGVPDSESTTMGIRAEIAQDDTGFDWMDEEEDAVEEGKSLLSAGRYEEAVDRFLAALEPAEEQNRALYLFYIGYACAMAGKDGPAMRYLNESDPSASMPYYADYVLLKGRLLLEGQAYGQALELFDSLLQGSPEAEAAQSAWFLSAFSAGQLGLKDEARSRLERALSLDPDSETGKRARAMLDAL